jgi:hypothetical protein
MRAALLILMTFVCAVFSYELCFMDTTFGGWLPFVMLTIGPVWGAIVVKSEF